MASTIQARFVASDKKLSVGEPTVELVSSVSVDDLSTILRALIKAADNIKDDTKLTLESVTFDFIVGGRLLRQSLDQHLETYTDDINAALDEKLLDIEYFIATRSPKPIDGITTDDWVSCVSANDDYIICGCYDNSLHIWSLANLKNYVKKNKEQGLPKSYQQLEIKNAHTAPISDVKWLPTTSLDTEGDYLFVSCGHDELATIRKWCPKTKEVTIVAVLEGHSRSLNCVDYQNDLIATGSYDKTLRIWSLDVSEPVPQEAVSKRQKTKPGSESSAQPSKAPIMTLTGHEESITGVRWSEENLVTCSMDNTICIWDIEVGTCERKLVSAKPMLDIDYNPHNRLFVTSSCDRHIRLWDARAPATTDSAVTVKAAFTSHNAWVSSVTFCQESSNSNLFISGGYDNLVKQWDLRSPKASLFDLIGHHERVLSVDWSNKDYILSGSADSNVKIFGC